jgi:aminopeptidase N
VRPDRYVEINNFYTATVYEKGAEVVRMIRTIIGRENFRLGMDLYFKRHDGQAVTCDDFVKAMEDAAGADLTQFRRWYSQAGTPVVEVRGEYDEAASTYTLACRQSCSPTPGQDEKLPFHIPITMGLVGPDGVDIALKLEGEDAASGQTRVLALREPEQRFTFVEVPARPVPSLLRGFSAPVQLRLDASDADLTHLMATDSDAFNRWEAGQVLAARIIHAGVAAMREGKDMEVSSAYVDAIGRVLVNSGRDPAFTAECLTQPTEAVLAEQMEVADPDIIHAARKRLRRELVERYRTRFEGAFRHFTVAGPYSPDAAASGRRALRNTSLGYLMEIDDSTARALTFLEFRRAENMTDAMAALECLTRSGGAERDRALGMFYEKWKDEALVLDKWFRVQATSDVPGTLERVRKLTTHPAFDIKNPNRARSVLHAFAAANPVNFHAADGAGYRFVAEHVVVLDRLNPQIASRLARAFDRWRKYDAARQEHARAALESIGATQGLSPDVGEVVTRALA